MSDACPARPLKKNKPQPHMWTIGGRCGYCRMDRPPRPDPERAETTTGREHPETSHAAAARVLPNTGTQRAKVLDFIRARYPDGATDDEMQEGLGLRHQSQTPRRNELARDGWIEDSGVKRSTGTGADAIVWRFVP